MNAVLKPLLGGAKNAISLSPKPEEMYTTETKRQYQSFDSNRRDLQAKAEVTSTRRLLETYNAASLKKAVG